MTGGDGTFELAAGGARLFAQAFAPARPRPGPPVVLLHDALGAVSLWRDFPGILAEATGRRVLAWDRRGHGRSDPLGTEPRDAGYLTREADLVPGILAALGAPEAVLFGHSDGGTIALLAAARHPGPVRAVVSVAAHVFVEELTLAGLRAARTALAETDLGARLARHHGDKAGPLAAAWLDTWLAPWYRGWTCEADLRAIRCPVLALQGEADEYGTPAQIRAIVEGAQGGGLAEGGLLPGLAHVPHREAPDLLAARAADFLGRAGA